MPKVIAALGSQTHKIDRVIAVDTGSVDNSTKLLKSAGIPFFAEDREMGYGDAIEHALELTPPISNTSETQEWIWLIHDDCAPDKDALEELLAGIYIQNLRMYDVLMMILALQNPSKANELEQLHKDGKILGPDPALKIED